jgi:hypothetical protein
MGAGRAARVVATLGVGLALAAAAADRELVLRWADDRLTVRLRDAPASDVLAEFARQSGVEIRGALRTPAAVTAEFEGVPVADALHRLLGGESFALVYGEGDRLRAVRLLGASAPGDGAPVTPVPAARVVLAADDAVAAASKRPVRLGARLARALGAPTANFGELFQAALGARDDRARALAVRAWLGILEDEAQLRASVVGSLKAVDDATVVAWLTAQGGDRAAELARRIAAQDRIPELRDRAATLLRQLRARGSAGPGAGAPGAS